MDPTLKLALDITFYVLSALLGLCIGSFLNVCIYRLPRGEFFKSSRSYCPKCGEPIKAYDNIPLLSYIILKGRCRHCHERISPRYPIVEGLNMILWIVNYAVFGMQYITIVYDILMSTIIVAAMVDIDVTEIPDSSVITIIILALATFIPVFDMNWKSKLIGAFCISVPMLIIAFFGGMGMGDVKLYFALGLLFGWEKILVIFIISMIVGSIVGIINLVIKRRKENAEEDQLGENIDTQEADSPAISSAELVAADSTNSNDQLGENINCQEAVQPANVEKTNKNGSFDAVPKESAISENTAQLDAQSVTQNTQISVENAGDCDLFNNDKDNNDNARINIESEPELSEEEQYDKELEAKIDSGKAIPFGPFIVLATMVTVYFGDLIIDFYKSLLGF